MLAASVQLAPGRAILSLTRNRRQSLLDQFEDWLINKAGQQNAEAWLGDAQAKAKSQAPTSCRLRMGLLAAMPLMVSASFPWVFPHSKVPCYTLQASLQWPRHCNAVHQPNLPRYCLLMLLWAGIMRVGEALSARRKDLVLPTDGAPGRSFALSLVHQPRTRGVTAKHRSAQIDPADSLQLISAVFGNLGRDDLVWTLSPSALRRRFAALQKALGLPTQRTPETVPYDLASLRAGGATFLLQQFGDTALVQRRGRWMSHRVMEIYLQEIVIATRTNHLTAQTRQQIGQGLSRDPPTQCLLAKFICAN